MIQFIFDMALYLGVIALCVLLVIVVDIAVGWINGE